MKRKTEDLSRSLARVTIDPSKYSRFKASGDESQGLYHSPSSERKDSLNDLNVPPKVNAELQRWHGFKSVRWDASVWNYYEKRRKGLIEAKSYEDWGKPSEAVKKRNISIANNRVDYNFRRYFFKHVNWDREFTGRGIDSANRERPGVIGPMDEEREEPGWNCPSERYWDGEKMVDVGDEEDNPFDQLWDGSEDGGNTLDFGLEKVGPFDGVENGGVYVEEAGVALRVMAAQAWAILEISRDTSVSD